MQMYWTACCPLMSDVFVHWLSGLMTLVKSWLQPWFLFGSLLLLSLSDGQWGHSVFFTHSHPTSIFLKLILPFLPLPPKTSCGAPGFVWPRHCPVFITPLTGYPGPPRTCAAPRSLQECAGACNRLCWGHWVVRLSKTSQPHSALAAEWGSAWGGSPNRGCCQIPTVALHNHSHTGPDIPPGRGVGEEGGLLGREMVKSTFESRISGHFVRKIAPLDGNARNTSLAFLPLWSVFFNETFIFNNKTPGIIYESLSFQCLTSCQKVPVQMLFQQRRNLKNKKAK